jgi:hypothetical protein
MRIPGFGAEFAVYRKIEPHRATWMDMRSGGQVVPADEYYCPEYLSTCDCFTLWDCVKCTILEWPTACKNPFN